MRLTRTKINHRLKCCLLKPVIVLIALLSEQSTSTLSSRKQTEDGKSIEMLTVTGFAEGISMLTSELDFPALDLGHVLLVG